MIKESGRSTSKRRTWTRVAPLLAVLPAWLATGAITLALFHVMTAARLFELFHWAPSGRL